MLSFYLTEVKTKSALLEFVTHQSVSCLHGDELQLLVQEDLRVEMCFSELLVKVLPPCCEEISS